MLFQESEEENMYITSKYEPPTDFDTITIRTTNVSTNFGTISPTTNVTTNISKYEPSADYDTIDTITTPTANVSVDLDLVTTPITNIPVNYGTITPMTEVPEFFLLPEVDIKTCRVLLKPYRPRGCSASSVESDSSELPKDEHTYEGPLIYYEPNLTPETLAETNAKQLRQPKGDPRINREYALSLNVKRQKYCKSLQVLTYEQDKKLHNRKESTIIISFLDKFMHESQIRENFEECGYIRDCNIEKHPDYNHSLGIATVTYFGDEDGVALNAAREAVIRFNGKQIAGGPPIKVELDNDGSKLKSSISATISECQTQKGTHSPSNSRKSTPLANEIDMEIDDVPSPSPPMAPPEAPPIKVPLDPSPSRSLDSIKNKFVNSIPTSTTKDTTLITKLPVKDSSKISLKDSVPASKAQSKTFSTFKTSSKDFDSDKRSSKEFVSTPKISSKDSTKSFSENLDKNEQKQNIQFMNDDKEDGEIDSNTDEPTPRNIKTKGFERGLFDSNWRYSVDSRTRLSWREYDYPQYDSDRHLDRRRRNSSRDRSNKSKYSIERSRSRDRSPNGRSRIRESDQSRDKDNTCNNERDYTYRNTSERHQISCNDEKKIKTEKEDVDVDT
ncbi:10815_t:CDS:2, partial [Scutellospora calospora]